MHPAGRLASGLLVVVAGCGLPRALRDPVPVVLADMPRSGLPSELEVPPPHGVSIRRTFHTPEEERVLRIAEAHPPGRDRVLSGVPSDRAQRLPDDDCLWWNGTSEGVRIPFAVTRDAVRYLLEVGDAGRTGGTLPDGSPPPWRSFLEYRATVERLRPWDPAPASVPRDAWLVRQRLAWSHEGTSDGGASIAYVKWRHVVLDVGGHVVEVRGDGNPPVRIRTSGGGGSASAAATCGGSAQGRARERTASASRADRG